MQGRLVLEEEKGGFFFGKCLYELGLIPAPLVPRHGRRSL
jgi:hypothetical protein